MATASNDGHSGLQKKWHHRLTATVCQFYANPSRAQLAFFWLNFVLPAGFYLLVSGTVHSVAFFTYTFFKDPYEPSAALQIAAIANLVLKLIFFLGIEVANLYAMRRFRSGRLAFLAAFVLNPLALPTGMTAFLPALLSILPTWSDIVTEGLSLARTGAISPSSLLLLVLTGQPVL